MGAVTLIKIVLWVSLVIGFFGSFLSMYIGLKVFYGDKKVWVLILAIFHTLTMLGTVICLYMLGEMARGVSALSFLFCYLLNGLVVYGVVGVIYYVRYKKSDMKDVVLFQYEK